MLIKAKLRMDKIKSLSNKMQRVFKLLMFVAPLVSVIYWSLPEYFNSAGISLYTPGNGVNLTFNPVSQVLGFLITLIPLSLLMYIFSRLKNLFENYSNGEVFSETNANIYKKLGQSIFGFVVGNMVAEPLYSLALSFQNSVGDRFVSLGFSGSDFTCLVVGAVVILVSHVMLEAHKLELDAKYTI